MTDSRPSPPPPTANDLKRYARQVLFPPLGEEGQRRLLASRVTLVGCGALGSVLADTLVRAGVGFIRIVDRDYLELNNLQRQTLFDEDDLAADLPKAEAARRKLQRINSSVTVEAVVADASYRNIEALAAGADLLLDGTDNFETRFLINDLAVKTQRPWVYGACVAAGGAVMAILPNDTPCLRCVIEEIPPPELNPTCDTAGVLASAVQVVAAHQAIEAIKILAGRREAVTRRLLRFDLWEGRVVQSDPQPLYDQGACRCCQEKIFEYLDGTRASSVTTLCGRDAVQVSPGGTRRVDFAAMAERLRTASAGEPRYNAYLLRARIGRVELTLFADGRAMIKGAADPDEARAVYAKYIGT